MPGIIMTKRNNNNFEQNPSKKAKYDLDDLWGEEFDDDEIEACVLRATQVFQHDNLDCTDVNDISILPSYNGFKKVNNFMYTSTQNTFNQRPSTSSEVASNNFATFRDEFKRPEIYNNSESNQLQIKLQKLEKEVKDKSGENTILRSRLNTIQLNLKTNYDGKIKETNDKWVHAVKDLQASRSEIQFKDLEIANLKHKILTISNTNLQNTSFNEIPASNAMCKSKPTSISTTDSDVLKLRPVQVCDLPLKDKIDSSIFKMISRNKFKGKVESKYRCVTQYDVSHEEILESYNFSKRNENYSLDSVYFSMAFLTNCTISQINDKDNYHHNKNILILLKLLLNNLHKYFDNVQEEMSLEAIRLSDIKYLERRIPALKVNTTLFNPEEWCKNEIGIQLRQLLMFVSELLPHSTYLKEDILERKHVILNEKDMICIPFGTKDIPLGVEDVQAIANLDCLSVILSCVTLISSMRKTKNCVGFLCSTLSLLCKICTNVDNIEQNEYVIDISMAIIKEIIRNCPNELVLNHLSNFMKHTSLKSYIVGSLCNMTMANLGKNSKQIIYFDSSSCTFQIFNILYRDCILNGDKNSLYVDTNLNMLKFFANILNADIEWLKYNDNRCVCLTKLVELVITINYELVKYCEDEIATDNRLAVIGTITEHILSVLSIKFNDLIENYLHICSQFRDIIYIIQNSNNKYLKRDDRNLLDQILIYEEIPDIRSKINVESFQNPIWIK